MPDQLEDDSAKHGCEHESHENDQHHSGEGHHSSCEDDTDDGSSNSSLSAGAVTAIVLVAVGSLVGVFVLIAVLCHSKYCMSTVHTCTNSLITTLLYYSVF